MGTIHCGFVKKRRFENLIVRFNYFYFAKMCSNMLVSSFVIVFILSITFCYCVPARTNIFETPSQCAYEKKQGQEKCLKKFCGINEEKFVCKALKCRTNYPGNGIADNIQKLECIKTECKAHPYQYACRKLKECEAKKNEPFVGLFSYINCVIKLFSQQ